MRQNELPVFSWNQSREQEFSFLVPERDIYVLAERLLYFIEHPEIWPEMGRAGRAYVEANYDINKLNDRLVDIYQELSDGKISSSKKKVEHK